MVRTAQIGDRVRIRYALMHISRKKRARPPRFRAVEFTVGSQQMIPTLSTGVIGMVQGDQKRFTLPPDEAYGPVKSKLIRDVPRRRFPKKLSLRVGQRLTATHGIAGPRNRVTVTEIKPHSVVVDGNHPLAGQTVEIDVMLISVDCSSNANKTKQQYDIGGES